MIFFRIATAVFIPAMTLSFFHLLCALPKNVGANFPLTSGIFGFVFHGFSYWASWGFCFSAPNPDAAPVSLLFIIMSLMLTAFQYILCFGIMYLGREHIYSFHFPCRIRKHRYADVKGCSCNYDTSIHYGKGGPRKVTTYEITVRFRDGTRCEFSGRKHTDRKVRYITETIRARRAAQRSAAAQHPSSSQHR